MSVGYNIKKMRLSRNLTLDDVVHKTGLAKSTLSAIENEKSSPSTNTLTKIANAFEVEISDFFNENPINENISEPNKTEKLSQHLKNKTVDNFVEVEENIKFTDATEALSFILKQPTVGDYGDFNVYKLSDQDRINFANDLLEMIKIISPKYKK